MSKLIWVIVVAFAVATAVSPFGLKWLKKLKFGQTIYDLGPETHKKKQGTPTMGGIIFAIAALVTTAIFMIGFKGPFNLLAMVLVSTVGFGMVGFVDDFIKVKLKRSLGLTPKQKLLPQIILAIGIAFWAYFTEGVGDVFVVPYFNVEWHLGWFYIPVMVFILVGTVNSANLLDGLDGLLSGCSLIDFATMTVLVLILSGANVAMAPSYASVAIFGAAMVGALLGFLRVNFYPAKTFMGDVGSFFIGGALVGMATVTRLSLILPIIAFAMFVSSLSDIIQITYFKKTHGKRIFKMAPLHHHFEKCGMAETHITMMYYVFTALLCLLALVGFVA